VVGAVIGGWIAHLAGFAGIMRLNVYSVVVAVCGAMVFLLVYHVIRRNVIGR